MECNSPVIMVSMVISYRSLHGLKILSSKPPTRPTLLLFRGSCFGAGRQYLLTSQLKHSAINRRWAPVSAGGASIEELVRIGTEQTEQEGRGPLDDYMDKVQMCNRGQEKKLEFLPFIVENKIIGYVHPTIMQHLKQFQDVFTISEDNSFASHDGLFDKETCINGFITFHHQLKTPDERTKAVGDAIKWLNKGGVVLGVRSELFPVVSAFGMEVLFSLERAAVPYFGTKAYHVHVNGYVNIGGEKHLWIGKRSEMRPTYPGLLDNLVGGGLPTGMTCKESLIKECDEEAGIPKDIAKLAVPVGAASCADIDKNRFKRDVIFCYDLQLPDGFQPKNKDGEVEDFMLVPIAQVANIICKTKLFKPNCALGVIDFLFRHGYISPEELGYLHLLQSLRRGECL